MEATIISWLKNEGEKVEAEEPLLEVATDKVDTEVPAIHAGIINKFLAQEGDIVQIGSPIALLTTNDSEINVSANSQENGTALKEEKIAEAPITKIQDIEAPVINEKPTVIEIAPLVVSSTERFYSPLIKNIAREEGISKSVLDLIIGTGKENRVTKNDIINFLKKQKGHGREFKSTGSSLSSIRSAVDKGSSVPIPKATEEDEVIEMSRVRRIIADRMVESRNISAHVHSFVEADVSNIVEWRNKVKGQFFHDYGEKLTFTPIFIEALAKALQDFPMMNISVDGYKIIKRKRINVGIAVALPDGNLIVPVIKNANQLKLVDLARKVNDFAARARENQLSIEEITGSTYTLTNVGS
ncbi:MAG: 2-oxo acid dehydrogenase subunit E2, partial [Cyclobacteriaceae bacterium]|nr:2-oxo acid dehydrogenase subunit E2 [Cyclobacteriaceae bacterium]